MNKENANDFLSNEEIVKTTLLTGAMGDINHTLGQVRDSLDCKIKKLSEDIVKLDQKNRKTYIIVSIIMAIIIFLCR